MNNIVKFIKNNEIIVVANCSYESFKEYISQGYEICGDTPLVPAQHYVYKHMREIYSGINSKQEQHEETFTKANLTESQMDYVAYIMKRDYISKKELKEKINAIDIKHISSNEMFRIEVLDLIQDF